MVLLFVHVGSVFAQKQGSNFFSILFLGIQMGSWGGALWPLTYCFFLKTSYRGEIRFFALNLGCFRGFSSPPSVILVLFGTCRGCGGGHDSLKFQFLGYVGFKKLFGGFQGLIVCFLQFWPYFWLTPRMKIVSSEPKYSF